MDTLTIAPIRLEFVRMYRELSSLCSSPSSTFVESPSGFPRATANDIVLGAVGSSGVTASRIWRRMRAESIECRTLCSLSTSTNMVSFGYELNGGTLTQAVKRKSQPVKPWSGLHSAMEEGANTLAALTTTRLASEMTTV